jgi:hypothetical protein
MVWCTYTAGLPLPLKPKETKMQNPKPVQAKNVVALIVVASCGRCDGSLMDYDSSSHDLTSDTRTIVCDDCGAPNVLGKTARLFA